MNLISPEQQWPMWVQRCDIVTVVEDGYVHILWKEQNGFLCVHLAVKSRSRSAFNWQCRRNERVPLLVSFKSSFPSRWLIHLLHIVSCHSKCMLQYQGFTVLECTLNKISVQCKMSLWHQLKRPIDYLMSVLHKIKESNSEFCPTLWHRVGG